MVIGNMSGWILQDVGSVARPWEHPLFWGGGPPSSLSLPSPLVPPTSGPDDGGRGEAGIKLSFILAGTLTLYTVRKVVLHVPASLRTSDFRIDWFQPSDLARFYIGILTPVIAPIRRDSDVRSGHLATRKMCIGFASLSLTQSNILINEPLSLNTIFVNISRKNLYKILIVARLNVKKNRTS